MALAKSFPIVLGCVSFVLALVALVLGAYPLAWLFSLTVGGCIVQLKLLAERSEGG